MNISGKNPNKTCGPHMSYPGWISLWYLLSFAALQKIVRLNNGKIEFLGNVLAMLSQETYLHSKSVSSYLKRR